MAGGKNIVEICNVKLKKAIQSYYVSKNKNAVLKIIELAKQLAELYGLQE